MHKKSPALKQGILVLLFFLRGIVSDISGVAPDHDVHDTCLIDKAYNDWPENE